MTYLVIHTNATREPFVNHRLQADGFTTFWPHYPEWVRKHRGSGKRMVLRSYFPRYLFVEADPRVYQINNTEGVATILYGDDGPYQLADDDLADLRAMCSADGLLYEEHVPTPGVRQRLKAGEQVTITEGPLAGFLALVGLDDGTKIKVEVEMFRGHVAAEMRPDQVKAVGRARRSVA